MTALELVAELAGAGVRLYVDGDLLRYEARPGAVTGPIRAKVAARRDELIVALSATAAGAGDVQVVPDSVALLPRPEAVSPAFVQNDQGPLSNLHNRGALPGFDPARGVPSAHWRAVADLEPVGGLVGLVGVAIAGELLAAAQRWERARFKDKPAAAAVYGEVWSRVGRPAGARAS